MGDFICPFTEDGQNNGNIRQYRNKNVCVLCEYFLLFFCLFLLCSASVNTLQIVFSSSLYESTAKWEIGQIFKADRLSVCV